MYCTYNYFCSRVECRVRFYAIFENGHIAANKVYFYEFNSKKSANCAATLKVNIFCWNFANIFLLLQRTIHKRKFGEEIVLVYFMSLKWANLFSEFLFFFSFKQTKKSKKTFPPGACSKRCLNKICLPNLEYQSNFFFLRPCAK